MKKYILTSCLFFVLHFLYAQDVLTIQKDNISLDEFKAIFYKNNHDTEITKEYLDEYMDLFINFKLKVKAAEEMGLDTISSFIQELNGYKKQLSLPYLQDKDFDKKILEEAYERMKYDINVSHILFEINQQASPQDTLIVYDRALSVRERIMNGKISFKEAALKYSADKSSALNKGDLGFFTVFMMVYPFESAAYNTPLGGISHPIRTKYGYHLVRVNQKREAVGEVQVAHIMCKTGSSASENQKKSAKKKIDKIWQILKSGKAFSVVAEEYSEDRTTAIKGGILPRFGVGKMVKEFEDISFSLKNIGDFSKPFETEFGYHIVSLIDKQGISEFKDVENKIKNKIRRDSRGLLSKKSLLKRLKTEYILKEFVSSKGIPRIDQIKRYANSSVKDGNWDGKNARGLKYNLFQIGNQITSQRDFIDYILLNQSRGGSSFDELYSDFLDSKFIEYEEGNLGDKHPEYSALLNEYREGILLFDLTNTKVWQKAVDDTLGLKDFHSKNQNKYMWDTRINADIYHCANLPIVRKVKYEVRSAVRKGKIYSTKKYNVEELKVSSGKFLKGANIYVDKVKWEVGVSKDIKEKNGRFTFIHIKDVLSPEPKLLDEVRGKVISDYQQQLNEDWVQELRLKYNFSINKEVLYSILK
ncbi:MAG: peptidylprolyl isomerase [Bacteroidota bacterium]|nr:peptidylprolyl isomerase [Bacteroidota bacterium]